MRIPIQETGNPSTIDPSTIAIPKTTASEAKAEAGAGAGAGWETGKLPAPNITDPNRGHPSPLADSVPQRRHPLRPHSLRGSADELRKQAQEQTPLLGFVCLYGQATVWYAKPNTGKTLIALRLLRDAVEEGRISGGDAYYVAADDTSAGVLSKLEIFEQHGVHILCPGWNTFEAKGLSELLREMIVTGTAKGTFLILDTLKKFVSLMDKRESSAFAALARQFVMKGGTLLGLAHTNKRAGEDGKPIYAGTSDILDDFDCGYTIAELAQQSNSKERVVQFACIKRRGDVAQKAAYGYTIEDGASYPAMLNSVHLVDEGRVSVLEREAGELADQHVISAIEQCIKNGTDSKMEIAHSVSASCSIGRQRVIAIIEKYTGPDPDRHKWSFSVGGHGKQSFSLTRRGPRIDPNEEF